MQRSPSDVTDVAVELAPERPRAGTAVDDEAEELARRFEGGAVAEVSDELCARGSEALFELTMSFLSSYGRMALFRALPLGAVSSPRAGDADSSSSGSAPAGIVWRARCFPFLRPSEMTIVLLEADIADAEAYVTALAPGARADALTSMSFGAVQKVQHLLSGPERISTDLARAYGATSVGRLMHHVPPSMVLLATSTVAEVLAALAARGGSGGGGKPAGPAAETRAGGAGSAGSAGSARYAGGLLLVRDAQNKLLGWTDAAALLAAHQQPATAAALDGSSDGANRPAPPAPAPAALRVSYSARNLSAAAAAAALAPAPAPAPEAGSSAGSGAGAMPPAAAAATALLLSDVVTPFLSVPEVSDESDELLRMFTVSPHATLPVVDAEGVLKGLVRHHDALKVLNDRIATISAGDSGIHSYSKASAFLLVKKRLFWLLVLAALNFGVAAVVATFEETISQNLVLAGFIPLLAGMGGNIGAQASGLVIAGTSSRDISPKDIFRVLWKEMFVSSALAGLLGCVTAAMGYLRANEGSKPQIALTLGSSMFVISMAANFLGVIFPFGAIAVGIDPAVSSSPLITTVIDVFGISVYLAIARSILGL